MTCPELSDHYPGLDPLARITRPHHPAGQPVHTNWTSPVTDPGSDRRGVSLFAGPREPSITGQESIMTTPTLEPVTGLDDDRHQIAEPARSAHDRRATVW